MENGNYILETGTKDQERLFIVNDIVNPYSIPFLRQHIHPGAKVLEVGCGIGLMSQEIAKIVGEKGSVLGTDLNTDQVIIACNLLPDHYKKRLRCEKASAYDLSLLQDKYDVVYIRFLLIHLDDVLKVLEQIKTVLRPGGLLLIEDLAGNHTLASDPEDPRLVHVRKMDDLQEELQQSNFDIASTLGTLLRKTDFKLISDETIQPSLDTPNKRRLFSLGMKSLESALVQNNKLTSQEAQAMIKEVEAMEKDQSVKLYCYKVGQIAATF